jgi:predicted amidophosphoribosyltransferase
LCGKPLVSEKDYCLACRNGGEKFYDHLWVLFPYSGKYQKLLAAYKFGKNIKLAE